MKYTIKDITGIVQAKATITHNAVVEHVIFDSRKVYSPATSIFFALKGPRRNGHQFINDLYKKGIRNFIISEPISPDTYPEANLLLVNDTLIALQQLAINNRSKFLHPVIGITGSNGKTIVKEWLYQLFNDSYAIARSPKSFNSQIGVPLSVLQLSNEHDMGIFEAGISQPGEMEKLEKIIQPGIGVLTNIGDSHNEGFRDQEEKFLEKIKLFKNAELIVCHSKYDPDRKLAKLIEGKVRYCGDNAEDAFRVAFIAKGISSTNILISVGWPLSEPADEIDFDFEIPFTDDASIENAILCVGVCFLFMLLPDEEMDALKKKLWKLEPVEMRMQIKKGINNCYIINDSYSNDISSLAIALDYLKQQAGKNSTTVILSDIFQSGLDETELYTQVAAELKRRNIQRLIGIGEKISAYAALFNSSATDTSFYLSTDAFLERVTSHEFKESFILLKGARVFAFERISKWLEQKVHQTVLEINLNAIVHNLKEYQRLLNPSTRIMAMVKAFAYGSGGSEIAAILQYQKIDYLGVAYADEGVELRKAGISLPVMVMNPEENSFDAITENNLEPEIYSFELLQTFDAFLKKQGITGYPIHIEIETGMNRLGFDWKSIKALGEWLKTSPSFRIQSVFTHLAASEEAAQDDFTMEQFERFESASEQLKDQLNYSFLRHIANSAAIVRHPKLQLDMIRLGIGMYGVDSSGSHKKNLLTVATLKSTIAQIKHLKTGETVSYNRKGVVNRDSIIATVRIGYADGYPRRLGNGSGSMYVKGKLAPVIGTVCMDMTMIDITDIPGVKEGDEVIVFGKDLTVVQLAEWAGTIPYEIMTGISQRVKRIYFEE